MRDTKQKIHKVYCSVRKIPGGGTLIAAMNNVEEIKDVLVSSYGLLSPGLSVAPRGFVAETYIVESIGKRFFAKIVPISRYSENLVSSLPALRELQTLGIRNISCPIPTTNGQLTVESEKKVLVLFKFISGEWTMDFNLNQYADLIGSIHAKTTKVQSALKREDFAVPFVQDLKRHVVEVLSTAVDNAADDEVRNIIAQLRADCFEYIAKIEDLTKRLSGCNPTLVLTHGDGPGNVIQDKDGQLYVIDWDDLLLAPAERDTWFHIGTDAERTFLGTYCRLNPGYTVNKDVYAFYLYRRYLDDLEGFLSKILERDASEEQKRKNLDGIKHDCLEWLHPLIRNFEGTAN